ncbi:glycosyltransferase [Mycobacterium tuberculosis FJ05194]|nr:glycosyltransferase [Mycobacterium tuberculosis FJ05194]
MNIRFFYIKTIKKRYKRIMGKELNLEKPQSFSEKLQWLKMNYKDDLLTQCCDKFAVREYVKNTIGENYLNELYGVYDSFDEIDISALPDQFALKVNHSSGKQLLCTDKKKVNWEKQRNNFSKWLKVNYYYYYGEWCYKNVKPKIICEKFLENEIKDYKFYCFNGKPEFLYVSQGLTYEKTLKIDFYDLDWNKMPFYRSDYPQFDGIVEKPSKFEEMKEVCYKLAKPFPFVRVDLFEVDGKIYFSELTFYPVSGFCNFSPKGTDESLGAMLTLPSVK